MTAATYTATVQSFDDRRSWDRMVRAVRTFPITAADDDEAITRAQRRVADLNEAITRSEREHCHVAIELSLGAELIAVIHFDGRVA